MPTLPVFTVANRITFPICAIPQRIHCNPNNNLLYIIHGPAARSRGRVRDTGKFESRIVSSASAKRQPATYYLQYCTSNYQPGAVQSYCTYTVQYSRTARTRCSTVVLHVPGNWSRIHTHGVSKITYLVPAVLRSSPEQNSNPEYDVTLRVISGNSYPRPKLFAFSYLQKARPWDPDLRGSSSSQPKQLPGPCTYRLHAFHEFPTELSGSSSSQLTVVYLVHTESYGKICNLVSSVIEQVASSCF
jgi:hypothetical protein